MNLKTAVWWGAWMVVSLAGLLSHPSGACWAQEAKPSPLVLLRGVESARTSRTSIEVEIEIAYLSPPPKKKIKCLIEMTGDKRRCEVFEGDVPGQVVIRDGDVFSQYRRVKHEDIEVFDVRMATGTRGTLAFDPRILGLSDTMVCDIAVNNCLWAEGSDKLEVVESATIRGAKVWRVRANRGRDVAEFWIEQPSFRVHRKVVKSEGLHIEIESEFDNSKVLSPFPSKVSIVRTAKDKTEVRYTINTFLEKDMIDPGRFTIQSLGAPPETAVIDYRVSR